MSRVVVDASVALKWFVPEIHSEAAHRWLSSGNLLLAPDLLFAEAGNIIWKKVIRHELDEPEARRVRRGLHQVPLRVFPSRDLAEPALDLALALRCTVYDALYVVLAVTENAFLVSADRKLYDALQGTSLGSYLRWVEDAPPKGP